MSNRENKIFSLKDIIGNVRVQENPAGESIYQSLDKARRDWENAKNIFENATNPDLIDYAIYNVDATEKRYTYLLKQIKSKGV